MTAARRDVAQRRRAHAPPLNNTRSPDPPVNGRTHPALARVLKERGLTLEQAHLQGLRYLEPAEHAELLGNQAVDVPGILIPYADAKRQVVALRTKVLGDYTPRGAKKPAGYLSRAGSGNRLYLASGVDWSKILDDPATPLLITEGELKALKLCQEGYACVGLSGVWNWLTKSDDLESAPITDLMDIEWKGRRVYVVFDSDAEVKVGVRQARDALVKFLFNQRAKPFTLTLPRVKGLRKTGVDDWFVALGAKEAKRRLDQLIAEARSRFVIQPDASDQLEKMKFKQEDTALIQGLLPKGLVMLAGKPKVRKSFLALHLAHAVATGGVALGQPAFKVRQGPALYLGLEDNRKRIQKRLKDMKLSGHPNLQIDYQIARGELGCEVISRCVEERGLKLVVIDTLAKFRAVGDGRRSAYEVDYEDLNLLKELAERHSITVLIVHHERKATSEDVLESVSGTFAMTGGVDTILVLRRKRKDDAGVLHVVGRDLEDAEWALTFKDTTWRWLGDAQDVLTTALEDEILSALRQATKALGPKEIGELMGRTDRGNILRTLKSLVDRRLVMWNDKGKYTLNERSESK